jgi:alpha,alpha-trehalase
VHLNPKSGRWIPDHSWLQRHSNLAIALNIWRYYQATEDTEFLSYHGAEVLLEIARFFASITSYNQELGRYEILRVMGPDEYHEAYPDSEEEGLNNNSYTNVMVVWLLVHARKIIDLLSDYRREEICQKLGLDQQELDRWDDISRKMRVVFHGDGIISQFEGYDELLEFDWEGYRQKYGNIHRLDRILEAEGDTANRYKLSKQGDVLMLFYLFSAETLAGLFEHMGYDFDSEIIPRNVEYYMHRTSHGSTLSRIVHSWVLARSDRSHAWKFFVQALESDVADVQGGTTQEGIHLGAMSGTVDLLQRAYTGIDLLHNRLCVNPCLPEELARLRLRMRFRGHLLMIEITHDKLTVESLKAHIGPLEIGVGDRVETIEAGGTREFPLTGGRLESG